MKEEHLETKIGQYAVIIKDKKVLMLYPPNGPLWIYPGGRLNKEDNNHEEALKREVKEELNINIEVQNPLDVQMWAVNGNSHRYGVFFICKLLDKESKIKLSKEHTKYKWFSYKELMEHYSKDKERSAPGIKVADKLYKKEFIL